MHYNIKFTNMHETQEKANTQKQKGHYKGNGYNEAVNVWHTFNVWHSQQANNVYTTLVLGHIFVTSYMNVYTTLLQRM